MAQAAGPAPVILVILDGYGLSPIREGNAIMNANSPWLDWAMTHVPKTLLHASGSEVGLDWGEMGNSEVGHLNIGTGRIVMQDLPRITRAIADGSFFANATLEHVAELAKEKTTTLHIIGLASTGGVHAHLNHMLAMLDFAKKKGLSRVALHLISDGRDTPPETLIKDLPTINAALTKTGIGVIASVSGRYYAMDRDKRWDRIEKAYQAMVTGQGRTASSADEALASAKQANETDEFLTPTVIVDKDNKPVATINESDVVVFTNFRPDRARQLAAALTVKDFTDFKRSHGPVRYFASFASYGQESTPQIGVAFFAPPMTDQLAKCLSDAKLTQFHIAETEKYAHVTYFLNGGQEHPFLLEERVLVPSPKVATYDLAPAMSAEKVTAALIKRLQSKPPQFSVINFANPDMVGHTGNLKAATSAIELVDKQLIIVTQTAKKLGATLIVTADHGNAEQLINPETHQIDKEHTTNPVPCFIISPDLTYEPTKLSDDKRDHILFAAQPAAGVLADIAPTILNYLGLEKPAEMTGESLKGRL